MSEDKNTQETEPSTTVTANVIVTPNPQTSAATTVPNTPTETETTVSADKDIQVDELTSLKARATKMGLNFHPNIGLDTLRERINLKLRSADLTDVDMEAGVPNINDVRPSDKVVTEYSVTELTEGYANSINPVPLTKAQRRNQAIKDANRLVRVRIACMNPNKRDWSGEVITVSNSVVGTFSKFVQFNSTEGYHVPNIILQAIRERMCQVFVNGTNTQGQKIKRPHLINEFAVEVLPSLTADELKSLAQRQAMANGQVQ
jgi:hypothetical protein